MSTRNESFNNSSTSTGREGHGSSRSGQRGGAGSDERSRQAKAQLDGLLMKAVATDYEQSLIDRAREARFGSGFDPDMLSIGDDELLDTERALEQVCLRFDAMVDPRVDERDVAEALIQLSEMLGVVVPGNKGIDLFLSAIDEMPAMLLPVALKHVARTHKFMRMPLPADFMVAVEPHMAWLDTMQRTNREALASVRAARARRERARAHYGR